ncbi:hypothetical protein AAAC51_40770 [Priestia megaterium]
MGKQPIYIWEADDYVQLYGFPSFGLKAEGAKVAFFEKEQRVRRKRLIEIYMKTK